MMHRSSGKRNDAVSGISSILFHRDGTILRKEAADDAELDNSNSDHRKKKSLVLLSMLGKPRMKLLLLAILLLAAVIWYWNQRAIWKQQQAPLDHIGTLFWKPIWALTCPVIADTDFARKDGVAPIVVPVVMISARTVEQVQPVYETWSQNEALLSQSRLPSIRFSFALFNTTEYSRIYVNTRCRGRPRNVTFASRLFAVYQHVFTTLLSQSTNNSNNSNNEYFVIVEDDTILLDGARLASEVAWAIRADVGFYSFNPFVPSSVAAEPDQGDNDHAKQSIAVGRQKSRNVTKREGNDTALGSTTSRRRPSCVYQFSTTAQVISRRLMQQIIDADTDSFCRLPIDMYIARRGPWYASVHAVTRHIGKRLILSPPNVTSLSSIPTTDHGNSASTAAARSGT